MKTVLKSVVAILVVAAIAAACNLKSENSAKQNVDPIDTTAEKVVRIDSTTAPVDSVVAK